jgi:hypothetical protein
MHLLLSLCSGVDSTASMAVPAETREASRLGLGRALLLLSGGSLGSGNSLQAAALMQHIVALYVARKVGFPMLNWQGAPAQDA